MPTEQFLKFREKVKFADMLVVVQHQESAPEVPVAASDQREKVAAASSSLPKDVVHLIATRATTMQKIQKTDEFTDALQGEGCGCAKCDATTVS